jgi:glycosyltransferase involved in cell wall biosynthesis
MLMVAKPPATAMFRIAVMWARFGPYHFARLSAAAKQGKGSAEIVGIEVAENDADYDWAVVDAATNFKRHTLFPRRSYNALSARAISSSVMVALDDIKPDVLAVNGWSVPEAQGALAWCARRNRRAVVMSETKEDDSERLWWKEAIKRRRLSKFSAALVGGIKQKEYLLKLGMPKHRIFIGYDVVDNAHFEEGAERARKQASEIRNQLGLPQNYFFVCTRFLSRKNVDGLLFAYAAYRARYRAPWGLVIAGSGVELTRLREIERSLGLEGVIWLGFLQYDQLPLYYGLAAAFIHPAKSEPWGLVLNEAAASRLPLIVSDRVGAGYELLKQGENGFLFDPYDLNSICQSLHRITECSEASRAKMGYRSSVIAKDWGPDFFGRGLLAACLGVRSKQPT